MAQEHATIVLKRGIPYTRIDDNGMRHQERTTTSVRLYAVVDREAHEVTWYDRRTGHECYTSLANVDILKVH